jgi:hypothetical protein
MTMALQYDVIGRDDWDAVPAKQPKPPSEWEPILDLIEHGQIVRLPLVEEKDKRGKRLALGRRAALRGFKVEMRTTESHLLARRADLPVPPSEPQPVETRRGRARKQA